jgi:arsenite-transporting ATPase
LQEAGRTSGELAQLGVRNQHLVINGVFVASTALDPVAVAFEKRGQDALQKIPESLAKLPRTSVPLAPKSLLGPEALRSVGKERMTPSEDRSRPLYEEELPSLAHLVEELATQGRGVILTMGKGGVGKTTVAAAVAVALADRGFPVHLSTTDPAAHVSAAINGELPNLTVSRIDPVAETAAYSAEVMSTAGANLDAQGRALLEEDLRSPCTEEIAVFRAFARAVDRGQGGFVVLDTAPTGHTILLLDAALAYHREVTRQASGMPPEVELLLPRLRDPDLTRVLLVTLPEATPVHEAAKLQEDLKRAEIRPFAWVINQSLTPFELADPVLRSRQAQEVPFIREVLEKHTDRVALIPWQTQTPVGVERLRALARATTAAAVAVP